VGHKVHPGGLRVGVIHEWKSNWYTGTKEFPQYLIEDVKIRDHIRGKLGAPDRSVGEIARQNAVEQPAVAAESYKETSSPVDRADGRTRIVLFTLGEEWLLPCLQSPAALTAWPGFASASDSAPPLNLGAIVALEVYL